MCNRRLFVELIVALLLVGAQAVLLPLRLVATLIGGALVLAGVLGFPAWAIRVAVSAAADASGDHLTHALRMCVFLAAALPAGIALMRTATFGLPAESDSEAEASPMTDLVLPPDPKLCQQIGTPDSAGGTNVPQLTKRTTAVSPLRLQAARARLAGHELRLRAMSRRAVARPRRRRGEH